MILSESLWPGMTRAGFGNGSYVRINTDDRERFPGTSDDKWVSPIDLAKKEIMIARNDMTSSGRRSLAARAFRKIDFDDTTGCWLSPLINGEEPEQHTAVLWNTATIDTKGNEPLDSPATKDKLRVCDNTDCLNPRHYDFTHRKTYRDRLLTPEYDYYRVVDGGILPIWAEGTGVILPTVEESIAAFRELQAQCVPYTDHPELAPLTGSGISKITIDSVTGCWPVRQYYTRPEESTLPFQYDCYGRLGVGPGLRRQGEPFYQQMGHRVVAKAFGLVLEKGKVLNHECGFRPCCNPYHLSQVTHSVNVVHGLSMSKARQASGVANKAKDVIVQRYDS